MWFSQEKTEVLHLAEGRVLRILFDAVSHPDMPMSMVHGVRPPFSSGEAHRHTVETEYFLALRGQGTVIIDGETFALPAGSLACARPGTLHELRNDSPDIFEYYAIFVPGLSMQSHRDSVCAH